MSSAPATNAIGIEQQAAGENLNTWGSPKLNQDKQILVNMSAGWTTIAITGDTTISETNYSSTNQTETAIIDLTAGAGLAAAFNFTIPGRSRRLLVRNSSGYSATIKLSATSGFSLPTGRWTWVGTDGTTDVYNLGAIYVGTGYTVTNTGDVTNKSYVDTAIATAALPATSGTVLNSGADTTSGYLSQKVTGGGAVTISTTSPGGNEKTNVAVASFALASGAAQTTSFAAAVNTKYVLTKSADLTITLPAAPAVGDVIQIIIGGTAGIVTYALNGLKFYGSTTNPTSAGEGVQVFIYHSAARGWIDL